MAQTPERTDVVIAGGGFAGLALGIALRQGLGGKFAIVVADPFIGRGGSGHPRASAIAAGARWRLRELAGIATLGWPYPQSATVTNGAHERDHGGRACEHFLAAGPFAILPLKGRRCSIVWTEETEAAQRIVALPDTVFHAELERRFGLELGEIEVVGDRRVHPLGYSLARPSIAHRLPPTS